MSYHFTTERNAQILISLLKQYGIRRVVASPGSTNANLVVSLQQDPFFEMYSVADERSAAYFACGMAEETGEPVVISCTGATASRNYVPGLTEAYYRKLPVLAVTSLYGFNKVGHLMAQTLDRSQIQKDIARESVLLRKVSGKEEEDAAVISVNKALNALFADGGGPVHINLETDYSYDFSCKTLPSARMIRHYGLQDPLPGLPEGRIALFVGSHKRFSEEETQAIDRFCAGHDAVVFCDHTSGYSGKYKVLCALAGTQANYNKEIFTTALTIHLGEVSGNYPGFQILRRASQVWRVNEDGQLRDFGSNLTAVFKMSESAFFSNYAASSGADKDSYFRKCQTLCDSLQEALSKADLPFSNGWIARQLAPLLPPGSSIHLGILNSLRNWNFFPLPDTVAASGNVGGFGIDGGLSTLVGASMVHPDRLYFGIVGDLAFFYDINILANRHVGKNLRILLINNGKGAEFTMYSHSASRIGDEAEPYVAAAGHYGKQSPRLVRHFAEDCGFTYLSAASKEEFLAQYPAFVDPGIDRSVVFEAFTDSSDESESLRIIDHLLSFGKEASLQQTAKSLIKNVLGKVRN